MIKNLILASFLGIGLSTVAQNCQAIGNKQNGPYIEYYSNCTKKLECFYKNGQYDSTYTEWNEKGKLKIRGFYQEGKKQGVWRHEDETIANGYKPSYNYNYVEYSYTDGTLISAYEYVSFSDSITPKGHEKTVTYGQDTLVKRRSFHKNGQLKNENYSSFNGTLDGTDRYWDENGRLFLERFMNKGFPEKEIAYHSSYKSVTIYRPATRIESSLKQYDLSGKLLYEEHYDKKGKVTKKKGVKQTSK